MVAMPCQVMTRTPGRCLSAAGSEAFAAMAACMQAVSAGPHMSMPSTNIASALIMWLPSVPYLYHMYYRPAGAS